MAERMPAEGRVTVSERRSMNRGSPINRPSPAPERLVMQQPALVQSLSDHERQLQALIAVQPRVARSLVTCVEVLRQLEGPAETFGDIVTGQLDVHPARPVAPSLSWTSKKPFSSSTTAA